MKHTTLSTGTSPYVRDVSTIRTVTVEGTTTLRNPQQTRAVTKDGNHQLL